jgi:hypothetical protein
MSQSWKKWLIITKKIASVQAGILLYIIYYIIIFPLGLFLRICFKHKLLGHRFNSRANTFWIKKTKTKQDLVFAREQ